MASDHRAHHATQVAPLTTTGTDLQKTYGSRWDIRRELGIGIFSAEHRSADGRHIRFLAAHSAAELVGKIAAAEAGS